MKSKTLRILAVEDNPADFRIFQEYLREDSSLEYEVTLAGTLKEAMRLSSTGRFDVILLDLSLPDSTGLEGLEKIVATRTTLPVIVLTGLDSAETGLLALSKQAQDYLVKGKITSDTLIRSIRYAIERNKTEEEVRHLNAELERRALELQNVNKNLQASRLEALNLMEKAIEARNRTEILNEELICEIEERKTAEEALANVLNNLEEQVLNRTKELNQKNIELQTEIVTRRIAEEKLRETGEMLKKIFFTTHISIAYLDREFNYLQVNRAYAEEYGFDENFLIGRNHFVLFPDARNKEIFRKTVETGEPYSTFAQPFEDPNIPERGTIYLDWSLSPVTDHDGSVEGLIYILVDVTERMMMEDTIRKSQVRLKEAQRIAHLGYWEWDVQTNELYWSEETFNIFGRDPAEFTLTYEKFLECIHPEDREQVIHSVDETIRGESHYNVEHRLIKPDHSVRFVNEQGEVTFDTAGRAIRMVGTVLDITPLKILEQNRMEAIQIAEKASRLASIGELAGGITHEINQPLNAIKVTVDGILLWHRNNVGLVPETFISMLGKISGSADRISNIIKHMRAFWVTQDSRTTEVFNINEVVTQALSLITRQLSSHGIKTVTKLSELPPYITGNPLHLEQIVINIVHNAMNSLDSVSRKDKMVLVETLLENDTVKLVVTDNGTGLPERIGDRLFDPFYSTRQPGEGTGLGLAIVKRFVEEHKGFIKFANNPSGGAVFTIHFPILKASGVNKNEHTSH